jgi:cyclopropane fatty-acyl-phospholipid synthase-like methyltransferase
MDAAVLHDFRDRFLAWWHGYAFAPGRRAEVPSEQRTFDRADRNAGIDNLSYIDVVQTLWHEGFCSPGDPESIVELTKPLRLSPENSVLDIGAGFGGPDRAMAQAYGVWIAGLEANREFVRRGNEQSVAAGLAKHATLAPFDPDSFELPERKYDRVFSKEFLFTVRDKRRILNEIIKTLRLKGEFLFTDYLLGPAPSAPEKIAAWLPTESAQRYILSPNQLIDEMKQIGFDVRIVEDNTDTHLRHILAAFRRLAETWPQGQEKTENTSSVHSILIREIGVWLGRFQLLETQALRLYRIHAIKPSGQRMMSDW